MKPKPQKLYRLPCVILAPGNTGIDEIAKLQHELDKVGWTLDFALVPIKKAKLTRK